MRTLPLALVLLSLLTACGEPAHTIEFGMSPGQEAVIRVLDTAGQVTIRNDGATPLDVLWPGDSPHSCVAPGASGSRTLAGEVFVTVRPPLGLGGRGTVLAEDASGLVVSTVNLSPPATPEVDR